MLIPLIDDLTARAGRYSGFGTNFEGETFVAKLELLADIGDAVIVIRFRAEDQELAFHEELSLIAVDLENDEMALWSVSNNAPGMLRHALVSDDSDNVRERRLVFRYGQLERINAFRQEITLDLLKDGSIEYRYAWGVPHEKLQSRSRAILKPTDRETHEQSAK